MQRERHGESKIAPEYRSWVNMKARCDNPKNPAWPRYGGRGIAYDPRWKKYSAFLQDMGRKPSLAHSLERKNNNEGYNKANCVWATAGEQARNTRATRFSLVKARVIRIAYAQGISQVDLAKLFNVKQGYVSNVVREKCWKEEHAT